MMLPAPHLFVHGAHDRPAVYLGGDLYLLLASGQETGGAYAAFESIVPPGGGPPPHLHQREDEMFYVLEGEITFTQGPSTMLARPGTWVHAPRNLAHRFHNATSLPARMLIITMPAGLDEFFWQVGDPVTDRAAPIPPMSQAQLERLLALAPKFGIQIFPPG
jgi:quercetin dioxygenase-like cupin family protein